MNREDGQWTLLDHILLDKSAKERLLAVDVLKGAADEFSDHYLVEARLKICRGF